MPSFDPSGFPHDTDKPSAADPHDRLRKAGHFPFSIPPRRRRRGTLTPRHRQNGFPQDSVPGGARLQQHNKGVVSATMLPHTLQSLYTCHRLVLWLLAHARITHT